LGRDDRELGTPSKTHRLDEKALLAFLCEHLTGFSGRCSIQQFLGGQSNPTYLIEDDSGSYVLRKKPPGKLLPSAHAVDREFRVISALADTNVPVPTARLLCDDESVIGQAFYVMDYVPGRVITERDMPGCSPNERSRLPGSRFTGFRQAFRLCHTADCPLVATIRGVETRRLRADGQRDPLAE
jgi:aminoglycoside phosphotransferase (APT) family kinase protein